MYKLPALLMAASLVLSVPSWSQKKITLSAFTGSGISFFGGPGAVNKSTYHLNNTPGIPFPHPFTPDTMVNPYGKKAYKNFVAGLQTAFSLTPEWSLLLTTQYENTGGCLYTDSIISPSGSLKTNGKYKRNYDFISINPQIGRMLFQDAINISAQIGIDYALKLSTGDQCDYTDQNGQNYSIGHSGGKPEVNDTRITFSTSIGRKKWSIDIKYKHGLVSYRNDGAAKVYARLLQVRLMYTIFK